MTLLMQKDQTVEAFSLRFSRVAVPPVLEPSMSGADGSLESLTEHVDGDLAQARALADKHADSPTALARLAASEFSFGNRVSAGQAAKRVLDSRVVDSPALLVASNIFTALGDISAVELALEKVITATEPADGARHAAETLLARVAAHKGETDRALQILEHCDDVAGLSLKGALLVQVGQYHDAIRVLRAALRDIPDAPDALCNLGYAYAAAGSIRKAVRATRVAVALAPTDRTAGLNLAGLLLSEGNPLEAVTVIERLASFHPDDILLMRALAMALHAADDAAGALRRLRRFRSTKTVRDAPPVQQEELNLDIFLLSEPRPTAPEVLEYASAALNRCDHRSEQIIRVLAAATRTTKDLPVLESAYRNARKHNSRTDLLAVEYRFAYLRFEFDRCLETAIEWTRKEPFSAEAHIAATYMLALHAGDCEESVRVGQTGLRRGIRSEALRNNVAFALALGSKPDQAESVLPDPSENERALATAGLIEMMRGNISRGVKMYEACAQQIRSDGDHSLAVLASLHQVLAEVTAGQKITEDRLAVAPSHLKDADPDFAVVLNAISRAQTKQT